MMTEQEMISCREPARQLERAIALMHRLHQPDGCPWDAAQTHDSIVSNMLEECYEAIDAIRSRDWPHLREELGDVLMQVLFHTDIERELGHFDLNDVADAACKKLITRHPHVFGNAIADTPDAVLDNWDEIKKQERQQTTVSAAMQSVAKTLPALWRAEKIQKKAAKADRRPSDPAIALENLCDTVRQLQTAVAAGADPQQAVGDALFVMTDVARTLQVDPETALQDASNRYIANFAAIESADHQ